MDDSSGTGTDYSCFTRISACFFLSIIYVASLYVWSVSHDRDHPETIKRRFFSVFIVSLICPIIVKIFIPENILQQVKAGTGYMYLHQWIPDFQNLMWLRNQIVAPLSEEFTFRACMLPLLLQCIRPSVAIILCPLLFGVANGLDKKRWELSCWQRGSFPAHFHHAVEMIKKGIPMKRALYVSCFQFFYTTLFGAYSAFLFVRTGHLIAPFLVHSFCNHMGFPDFAELFSQKQPYRSILMILFVVGLAGWAVLLLPMTQPSLYHNQLFWIQATPTTIFNSSEPL
ncbi:hypothetical protein B566_EDAN002266 [Ephemera danica]|nr:hypothetical protein B566_EDAN002266 [Ephemera danica]